MSKMTAWHGKRRFGLCRSRCCILGLVHLLQDCISMRSSLEYVEFSRQSYVSCHASIPVYFEIRLIWRSSLGAAEGFWPKYKSTFASVHDVLNFSLPNASPFFSILSKEKRCYRSCNSCHGFNIATTRRVASSSHSCGNILVSFHVGMRRSACIAFCRASLIPLLRMKNSIREIASCSRISSLVLVYVLKEDEHRDLTAQQEQNHEEAS